MNLPKKIFGVRFLLAILLVLVLVYIWIFGRATSLVLRVRKDVARNPKLAVIPIPLPDTSVSRGDGTTLAYFGYEFEAPWKVGMVRKVEDIAAIGSESRQQALTFVNPTSNRGFVAMNQEEFGTRFTGLDPVWGPEKLRSDYDPVRAILNASPSQLSLVFPGRKEIRAATFLMVKESEIMGAETGLYSFDNGHLRGFQLGDATRAKNVTVNAFDAENHRFQFGFGSKTGPDSGFTQAEINHVLQSLRPITPAH